MCIFAPKKSDKLNINLIVTKMKKLSWMLAAILFCGTLFVSCNKETDTVENTNTTSTDVNPADLIGTWRGTYNGSTTYQSNQVTYSINWTVNLTTVSAGTMSALVTSNVYEDYTVNYIVSGIRPRQNTDYVILDVKRDGAIFEDTFEMLYNKSAKTLKGDMTLQYQEGLTIGGETTLNKQ